MDKTDPAPRRTAERRRSRDPYARTRSLLERQVPYLSSVRAPQHPSQPAGPGRVIEVATYNVHRWAGASGGRHWNPDLACRVMRELDVDVTALQEVLYPFDRASPLERLADDLNLHLAFVSTRVHRRGELGNAILSRWPLTGVFTIDLSFGRMERRSAVAVQFHDRHDAVAIVATHLSLVDRTRKRQVQSILSHPQLQGPVLLLGDMNSWRRSKATRQLEQEFDTRHHNDQWPASFPSTRPVMALDRVYARGASVTQIAPHDTEAARRGSDHLPVVARIRLDRSG